MAREAWAQRGGAPETPRELNRYAYARIYPLRDTDPAGHCAGGSVWRNLVSVFDGTCVRKGLVILSHARTPDEWALGAFAAFGPPTAAALLTAGTFGFVSPLLTGPVTALSTTETSSVVVVLDRVSRSEAREALRTGIKELSAGQVRKALDTLGRGQVDAFSLHLVENDRVRITVERAGRNGFQRLIYTLDQSGKTIGLTQHAYNAAGELVHVHDKLDDIATK